MGDAVRNILFGLLSLLTHVIEGITGFGSTALALPFGIVLAGVAVAVPVLSVHAWLLSAFVLCTAWRHVVWREYVRVMIPVLIGLPLGMWAYASLPEPLLKTVLGVFMVVVSVLGLIRAFSGRKPEEKPLAGTSRVLMSLLLGLGGVIHGAFSSGGPLLIVYVTRVIRDKSAFRATMCAFWFSLNLIMMVRNAVAGVFTPDVLTMLLVTLPFLAVGTLIGNWAHHKVKEGSFTKLVYGVLLLSGLFMLYASLPAALGI